MAEAVGRDVVAHGRLRQRVDLFDEGEDLTAERELHGEVEMLVVREGGVQPDDVWVRRARQRELLGDHLLLLLLPEHDRLEDALERHDLAR